MASPWLLLGLLSFAFSGITSAEVTLPLNYGFYYEISCEQVRELKKDIQQLISSTVSLDEDGKPYFPLIGGFVRLAFHMCTGKACQGCINVDDRNNNHLRPYIEALEEVYKSHLYIRRADLWSLAAIEGLRMSERLTNELYGRSHSYMQNLLRFRYGRNDCPTAPYTQELYPFPSAGRGLDHVLSFFRNNFGFTDVEIVALLGAHKLGGLRAPLSQKIVNQWVSPADTLDNSFYIQLVNASNRWSQAPHTLCANCTPFVFWTNVQNRRLMFNTDISLYKNLKFLNDKDGAATCTTSDSCNELSSTADIVTLYANSNDLWLQAFANVFTKMIEEGYSGDELTEPGEC